MEAEKAQDAQVVFAHTGLCIPHKADAACLQIRKAIQRIQHCAAAIHIERIHREIAARGILFHAVGERHNRMAPVGFNIAPERGHLHRDTLNHNRNRAMADPRGHGLQPGRIGKGQHRLRPRICRQIKVCDGGAQQGVAHAAAHEKRLMARAFQHAGYSARCRQRQPCGLGRHWAIASESCISIRAVAPQM